MPNVVEDEDPPDGQSDLVEMQSLADFISSYNLVTNEDDPEFIVGYQSALDKLKEFVVPLVVEDTSIVLDNDENVSADGKVLSEEEVDTAFARGGSWSASDKQQVKKILASFNPHNLDMKRISNAMLKEWLQRPNAYREIMFYTSESLKTMMQRKKMAFASGRMTMSRMVEALSGTTLAGLETDDGDGVAADTVITSAEAVKRAILEKSFLPHQKGSKREHCSLGHSLETPIVRRWIEVADEIFPNLEVNGVYTCGLAAKKGAVYAKDSIDFILAVEDGDTSSFPKLWGFEAKGRVTATTAASEERQISSYRNPHIRITDERMFGDINDVGERFQVLQHAFVHDLDTVVLAISDSQSELLQSAVIDFSENTKFHFGRVLQDLKDLALSWAYPDVLPGRDEVLKIPEETLALGETILNINGMETFQGHLNLWHALSQMPAPIPSCLRIIPSIYAFWNAVKGGSDTATKLMDDCLIQIPKHHMNTESVAISRCFMILMVLNHRLMQIFSAREDLKYPSLKHYREAASQRLTFHSSLLASADHFRKRMKRLETLRQEGNPSTPRPQPARRTIRRPAIDGVVPEPTTFGTCLPIKTPSKFHVAIRNDKAVPACIKTMVDQCQGIPMKKLKGQKTCATCSSKTAWFCAGCKRWLCVDKRQLKGDSATKIDLYTHIVSGEEMHFLNVCYHKAHTIAWERSSSASAAANKENGW